MKRHKHTIYLNGAVPVLFKETSYPIKAGQRYFKGVSKEVKLLKRERGEPGTYNATYSQSVN